MVQTDIPQLTLHSQATAAYIPGNWFIIRPSVSFVSVAGSPAVVSPHMKYFYNLCGSVEQSDLTRVGGVWRLLVKLGSQILFRDVFTLWAYNTRVPGLAVECCLVTFLCFFPWHPQHHWNRHQDHHYCHHHCRWYHHWNAVKQVVTSRSCYINNLSLVSTNEPVINNSFYHQQQGKNPAPIKKPIFEKKLYQIRKIWWVINC